MIIISEVADWSATEKTMDSENLEGHQVIFQGKATSLLIY